MRWRSSSNCGDARRRLGARDPVARPVSQERQHPHIAAEIRRQPYSYLAHLNTLFGTEDVPAIPPGLDGVPWRITTRQFRRTIAWHIANRPFGTVAGKIQYKHASLAAFEGYAGTSASGFRSELETRRQLGQTEELLHYYEQRRLGALFSGPAGPRIAATLDATSAQLGPLPATVVDDARVKAMLASVGRTYHAGALADCFFEPATALCLKQATGDARLPLVSVCEPTQCPNACITAPHAPL